MVWLPIVAVILSWLVFWRTRVGLRIRAVGENPQAAEGVGINVYLVRVGAVIVGQRDRGARRRVPVVRLPRRLQREHDPLPGLHRPGRAHPRQVAAVPDPVRRAALRALERRGRPTGRHRPELRPPDDDPLRRDAGRLHRPGHSPGGRRRSLRPERPLTLRWAVAGAAALVVGAAGPAAAPPAAVVWVQAGHQYPREPGYRNQTGAGGGPFGSEIGFTTRVAPKVVARLRALGIDARQTPGQVTPLGAPGAVFVSIHHGAPTDHAGVGYAVTGGGENWYHGEGSGTPSATPYPDSAPHRAPTTASPAVQASSLALARRLAAAFGRVHTPANGVRAAFDGVEKRDGNVRMMHFYGFYRTRADARVILEAGPAGA